MEGWETIFNDLGGSKQKQKRYYFVKQVGVPRGSAFSHILRQSRATSRRGRPLSSTTDTIKNADSPFRLGARFWPDSRPQNGPILGPTITTILFFWRPHFRAFFESPPETLQGGWSPMGGEEGSRVLWIQVYMQIWVGGLGGAL